MNISNAYPPNWKEIKKVFNPKDNTVFTYGNTIYAPSVFFTLPDDLVIHEETHMQQQGEDPSGWWERYLVNKSFRFTQELRAYQNQYKFYAEHHNRNQLFFFANTIARDLSGSMYGNIVDYQTALKLIRS